MQKQFNPMELRFFLIAVAICSFLVDMIYSCIVNQHMGLSET